jgi:hypothetical protein
MTNSMAGRRTAAAVLLAVLGAVSVEAGDRLTHRVWLLHGVPAEPTLSTLRAGGVDGLVLPVGDLVVASGTCRLTLTPLPDLKPISGWPVTPLVWVSGEGDAKGDAVTFGSELAPVLRLLSGSTTTTLALAARATWPGLVQFAGAVAERTNASVELLVPAQSAVALAATRLPHGVSLVVAAFGNPPALGFPASNIADDLAVLAAIDAAGARYRVAVVVVPRATPMPGAGGASLSAVALPTVADYRPADRGDAFVLRQSVDWGGTLLAPHDTIQVEVVDTARYHRDLGLIMRGVRPGLEGWDTAGLPDREPALGMSLEAFLDYLQGGRPYPSPLVEVDWVTATRLRLTIANPTPQASALASTGNWLEVRFTGAQLLDLGLGEFSGAEYGRVEAGAWHRAVAREASAIRLFMTYVAPESRLGGATVTFLDRPSGVSTRWVLRLGDGGEVAGVTEPLPVRKP